MNINRIAAALACPSRLAIVQWLKSPSAHFPPQIHADIETVGVCGAFVADKLTVSPATASAHLRILADAGLVTSTRIGKWTYFKRSKSALGEFSRAIAGL
jgi:DNA-binding transcriptional ArsR family regulator